MTPNDWIVTAAPVTLRPYRAQWSPEIKRGLGLPLSAVDVAQEMTDRVMLGSPVYDPAPPPTVTDTWGVPA